MKGIVKIAIFWLIVIAVLFMWRVFNDFAITPFNEALDNQSFDAHPFPVLDALFSFVWGGAFLIAIIVTAIYLYMYRSGGIYE